MMEVARRAGTSVSVICDIEHFRLLPSEPKLRAILCDGCGMTQEGFTALLSDFHLEYYLHSDGRMTEAAKSRLRNFARAERPE